MARGGRAALRGARAAQHHLQTARAADREVKARYWAVLDEATSASDARAGLLALAGDYRHACPSAIKTNTEHADQLVAHLRFPAEQRKRTRSTNLLERTFVEVRRRTKIIGRFPGETSALSLIWAVLALKPRLARHHHDPTCGRADRTTAPRPGTAPDRHRPHPHRGGSCGMK